MCAGVLAGVSARVVVNESVYVRVCACGCVHARVMIPVSRSFIQTKKRKWNFKGFLVFCHVQGFFGSTGAHLSIFSLMDSSPDVARRNP